MNTDKIVILGTGSIGAYLGGRLMQGGADVRLVGRARQALVFAREGLSLSAVGREPVAFGEVEFGDGPEALAGASVVGVCVKSQDTADAAAQIARHAPDADIVSFQNGVSNLGVLRAALPKARISGSVVPFNVTSTQPGHYHRGTDGALIVGPHLPAAMAEAFAASDTPVTLVEDIDAYLWAKLLVNLNNALNALSGGPLRDGLLQRSYRRVLIAMIEEGLAVAQAEGANVATFNGRHPRALARLMSRPDWLYRFLMDRIAKIDRTARSSMLDDLESGRGSELDYLQGEIVRRADALGLDAPVNRAVMEAARDAFAQGKSPRLSGPRMQARFLG
jgi:2-dehydropantoate 2-reductase